MRVVFSHTLGQNESNHKAFIFMRDFMYRIQLQMRRREEESQQVMELRVFQAYINQHKDRQCNQREATTAGNKEEESEEIETGSSEESDEEMIDQDVDDRKESSS